MRGYSLQYTVLIIGTIVFSALIYLLVEGESGKLRISDAANDFNQQTIEPVNIYANPDNNSTIIATATVDTKVKTTAKTKFYFKITKVDGHDDISNGYILKTQLKRLE